MDDDRSPCKNAIREIVIYTDTRSVDDPKKIPCYKKDDSEWWIEGKNHRVEHGEISRDFEQNGWTIEMGSIEDLLEFMEEEGHCITLSWHGHRGPYLIEIVDGY